MTRTYRDCDVYESADSRNKLWIDARIGITAGAVAGSINDFNSGTELRRARFAVKTIFDNSWAAEIDVDVTDNEIELEDAWIGYLGWPNTMITIGNQKIPIAGRKTDVAFYFAQLGAQQLISSLATSWNCFTTGVPQRHRLSP